MELNANCPEFVLVVDENLHGAVTRLNASLEVVTVAEWMTGGPGE